MRIDNIVVWSGATPYITTTAHISPAMKMHAGEIIHDRQITRMRTITVLITRTAFSTTGGNSGVVHFLAISRLALLLEHIQFTLLMPTTLQYTALPVKYVHTCIAGGLL